MSRLGTFYLCVILLLASLFVGSCIGIAQNAHRVRTVHFVQVRP